MKPYNTRHYQQVCFALAELSISKDIDYLIQAVSLCCNIFEDHDRRFVAPDFMECFHEQLATLKRLERIG